MLDRWSRLAEFIWYVIVMHNVTSLLSLCLSASHYKVFSYSLSLSCLAFYRDS